MFIDEVQIKVTGGRGGDGVVRFRREKYEPRGGPDGGDGGRGGHVLFKASAQVNTLSSFRNRKVFKASDGKPGDGGRRHGAQGEDIVIPVPLGTMIFHDQSGALLADLVEEGQEYLAVKGGSGGRGNASFATATNQAPRKAELGLQGQTKEIRLELKLLAEVGLLGLPNAGKSTLLSRVSNSRPKIASYPFTTLTPQLGVVDLQEKSMVWTDLPGIIEGAHKGVGLGHRFLRHSERTRILLHVVDGSGLDGVDPLQAIEQIEKELEAYSRELAERPSLIVINKMDLQETRENVPHLTRQLDKKGRKYCTISAVTGEGIKELLFQVETLLEKAPHPEPMLPQITEPAEDRETFPFKIVKEGPVYEVLGGEAQRRIDRTDFSSDEGVRDLLDYLKRRGLYEALREKGVKEGDTVRIGPMEFDYFD